MTKNTYILVDSLNTFMRSKHVGSRGLDLDSRLGMSLHIMLSSVKSMWDRYGGTHVVFLMEGRSWRKDFYPPYKQNRKTTAAKRTPREIEEDAQFMEAYDSLMTFLMDKTNTTVLKQGNAEADDLIAAWIQHHPNDDHVVVSSDSDFVQLLAPNVRIYNGVTNILYTHHGVYDDRDRLLEFQLANDGKVKVKKPDPNFEVPADWIERSLFYKCIRGDTSDNIFSAYPGARQKGTKNKIGISEAFDDRAARGFNYNNFMLQRWTDHEETEHRVRDDYERNRVLIDLTRQPEDVREQLRETVLNAHQAKHVDSVGIKFMKFCGLWDLQRLSQQATDFGKILNASIPEDV